MASHAKSGKGIARELMSVVEFFKDDRGIKYAKLNHEPPVVVYSQAKDLPDRIKYLIFEKTGRLPGKPEIDGLLIQRFNPELPVRTVLKRYHVQEDGSLLVRRDDHTALRIKGASIRRHKDTLILHMPQALPLKVAKSSQPALENLFKYLPTLSPEDRLLLVAFMVDCCLDTTPYPILLFVGPSGSAKSTATKVIQKIVDPSNLELLVAPASSDDVTLPALNTHLLAFNNVRTISKTLQDILCIRSTGGTYSKREHHTNTQLVAGSITGPTIINAINDPASEDDFYARVLLFELAEFPRKIPEEVFWRNFDKDLPGITRGFLQLAGNVLEVRSKIEIDHPPRMADFARTLVATERVMGCEEGIGLRAYSRNRRALAVLHLQGSPTAQALVRIAESLHQPLTLSTDQLRLRCIAEKTGTIPTTAKAFGAEVRRLTKALSVTHRISIKHTKTRAGINITIRKRGARRVK